MTATREAHVPRASGAQRGYKWGMNAAGYIRVSTRQQDLEAQRAAILKAADARGDVISKWYAEKTGAQKLDRAELTALRAAVRRGDHRKVYVFRIDRLCRSGIRDTLAVVHELRELGCVLATVADDFGLDGPAGDVVLAVMAWAAQMERSALIDRAYAARELVEARGGHWGRPHRVTEPLLTKARIMRNCGKTIRQISVALKIPRATIYDALSGKGRYATKEKSA